MLVEGTEIYPLWDLIPPVIPARSRLYPLEPVGLGTSEVESLSSYVLRLADAHLLPVAALVNRIVAPLIQDARLPSTAIGDQTFLLTNAARPINGMGVTATTWIRALEALTLRKDLRCLTALAWQGVFTTRYWLRPVRAWCPACFETQHRENRIIFEHLRWTLRVVNACPIHQRALVTACPHCGRESLPLVRRSRPGHCPQCLRWLGSMDNTAEQLCEMIAPDAWDWCLWAADAVGELLAGPPGIIQPARATIIETLAKCVDHFTEGCTTAFAFHFGLSAQVLRRCMKGEHFPRLDMLLRICYLAGLRPQEFINGTTIFPEPATRQHMLVCPTDRPPPNKTRRYGQERQVLQAALGETPPPSPAEVTTRLSYCRTSVLRRAHPELCWQIETRDRVFQQEQKLSQMNERLRDTLIARQIIGAALQEHPPPSAREVARRLGYSWIYPLQQYFPESYRQILDRRREYQMQIDKAVQNCFQLALGEDPPPRISELARRLGFISAATLKIKYPDLCRALNARYPEYLQRRLKQVETILEQACYEQPAPSLRNLAGRCGYQTGGGLTYLFPELCRQITARYAVERKKRAVWLEAQLRSALDETVPPSVKELCKRLNYEKGTLYGHFPELCAELSARRSGYLKEEIIKREQQRREEIRRIVIDLHNRGIYPSYASVQDQFSDPLSKLRHSDSEILNEVKRELGIHTTRR